jgi:hypothetical protein
MPCGRAFTGLYLEQASISDRAARDITEANGLLNDLVCIAEGQISAATREMVINVYAGIHEMQA